MATTYTTFDKFITLTRPGKSWRIVNGVLREYDVNEPCLTGDGWSVRPAETNLLHPSRPDIAWPWNWQRTTRVGKTGLLPTGATGEFAAIVATPDLGSHYATRANGPTIPADTEFWESYIVSAAEASDYVFVIGAVQAGGSGSITKKTHGLLRISTGEFTPNAGGSSDPKWEVERLVGGWVRLSVRGRTGSGGDVVLNSGYVNAATSSGTFVGTGDGVTPWFGYYAAWVNTGSTPIPYIPTTDSAVTRPADNASIQGDAFASIWNPMEGAIVWEFVKQPPYSTTASTLGAYGVNGGADRIALAADWYSSISDNRCGFQIITNGQTAPGLPSDLPALSVGDKHCMAISFDQTGVSCAIDGQILGSNIPLPYGLPDVTRLSGVSAIGVYNSIPPEKHRRLTIFNRRPSDAEMQAMTS